MVTQSSTNVEDLSHHMADLRALLDSFTLCDDKLIALKRLSHDINSVCSDCAQVELRATIARLDAELATLRTACQQLADNTQAKMFTLRENRARPVRSTPEPSLWWRLLRRVLPLALAATLFLTLLCILDPTFPRRLVFSPKLRYVRGPPPI